MLNAHSPLRGLVFFVTLGEQLAENANKSYHVYKMKVVQYILNKSLVIRFAGHPAT